MTFGPLGTDEAVATCGVARLGISSRQSAKISLMKPGHYLYRDRFEFRVDGKDVGAAVTPKLGRLTQAKVKIDPTFGKTTVFETPFSLELIPVTATKTELEFVFQGCSEVAGVCYPPAKRVFVLTAGAKYSPPNELQPASLKNQFKPQVSQ